MKTPHQAQKTQTPWLKSTLLGGAMLLSLSAYGTTWTYTGATGGLWSTGTNWSPASSPTSSQDTIVQLLTGNAATSSTDDLGAINLNNLSFGASSVNYALNNSSSSLTFLTSSASVAPTITVLGVGVGTINVNVPITLGANLTVLNGNSNTNGILNFNGIVSETGGAQSLTITGTSNDQTYLTNNNNSFSGGFTLTGGIGGGLGSGAVTIGATGNSILGAGSIQATGGRLSLNTNSGTAGTAVLTINRDISLTNAGSSSGAPNSFLGRDGLVLGANTTLNNASLSLGSSLGGTDLTGATFTFASASAVSNKVLITSLLYNGLSGTGGPTINVTNASGLSGQITYTSKPAGSSWNPSVNTAMLNINNGKFTSAGGSFTFILDNGAVLNYNQLAAGAALTVLGRIGGNASANSTGINVGRILLQGNGGTGTYTVGGTGIQLVGALQITNSGNAQTLGTNLAVTGATSNDTAFEGAVDATSLGKKLSIGSSSANTLNITENPARAIMDFSFRDDIPTNGFVSGIDLVSNTNIGAKGTLVFKQSQSNQAGVTYDSIFVSGSMTALGSDLGGGRESTILFDSTIDANGGSVVTAAADTGVAHQVVFKDTSTFTIFGVGVNGLRVEGSKADVDGYLSSTRLKSGIGNSGTLTVAYTDTGSPTRTFTNSDAPSVGRGYSIGFDAVGGNNPIYRLDASTGSGGSISNFGGLVIKGGTVQLASNVSFTGVGGLNTTFVLVGGTLDLTNGAGTAHNVTFETTGDLRAGTISGGASGGTLILGGFATKSTNGTVNLNGKIKAPLINIAAGTLSQGASNLIDSATAMQLSGGTWATNGNSQGTTAVTGLGTLTLSANSSIDFANGANTIIHFQNSNSPSWNSAAVLSITNWNGNIGTGGGSNQLIFGTNASGLNAAQLSQIVFINPSGWTGTYGAMILANGEVVPVPEANNAFLGLGLAVSSTLFEIRRRKKRKVDKK